MLHKFGPNGIRTQYIRVIGTTLIPTELTSHMCICCIFSFIFQHTITYTLLLSEYKETFSVWHLHFSNGPVPKKTSRWMVLSSIYNRNDNICIHFSNSSKWERQQFFWQDDYLVHNLKKHLNFLQYSGFTGIPADIDRVEQFIFTSQYRVSQRWAFFKPTDDGCVSKQIIFNSLTAK